MTHKSGTGGGEEGVLSSLLVQEFLGVGQGKADASDFWHEEREKGEGYLKGILIW